MKKTGFMLLSIIGLGLMGLSSKEVSASTFVDSSYNIVEVAQQEQQVSTRGFVRNYVFNHFPPRVYQINGRQGILKKYQSLGYGQYRGYYYFK